MSKWRFAAILSTAALVAVGAMWWLMRPSPVAVADALPETCRDTGFEGASFVVCEIAPRTHALKLFWADAQGQPFGSLVKFDQAMVAANTSVLLAMNAGMYHKDLAPVGLFIEDGRQQTPLNISDGEGNFFMKPNGVFLVAKDGNASVMEASAYAAKKPDAVYATQSGPMLVIDGQVHPRFEENGASRYIRNGVGVREDGTVVLAISRSAVSLGSFARLFRDSLGCRNALFLDGAISALSNGRKIVVGGNFPAGPILAVTAKAR